MSDKSWLRKDFYAVLGVSKGASDTEIKKAYRVLALRHHPDANNGDAASTEMFKQVAEAYAVLSRSAERSRYDRLRSVMAAAPGGRRGFQRYAGSSSWAHPPIYRPPMRGRDMEHTAVLSHREARRGATLTIETFEPSRPSRTVFVRVPAGVSDGQSVCVKGRGGAGLNGGPSGDLYLKVRILAPTRLGRTPRDPALRTAGRERAELHPGMLPRMARMLAHLLLNPTDVELNEALWRQHLDPTADHAENIRRQRRAARR